jgi:hypothetical protein
MRVLSMSGAPALNGAPRPARSAGRARRTAGIPKIFDVRGAVRQGRAASGGTA